MYLKIFLLSFKSVCNVWKHVYTQFDQNDSEWFYIAKMVQKASIGSKLFLKKTLNCLQYDKMVEDKNQSRYNVSNKS